MYYVYIDANSLLNNKQTDGKVELMQFTTKDMYLIQDIANEKNLFKLIVNSVCPSIFGHEMVKAGLALALFGGCQKLSTDKTKFSVRGDPHLLVVGDPGLGKSQMLTAVANLAPRGVYVCGSYSSSSGLTVTLLKEKGSGDYALEAGALVLGDQGICCIDEFDKMRQEHQALLEAMEQQTISIAKAGIVATLPARTSVIAAANPIGGHYNKAKTVSENLKLSPSLLSRFDLIFILMDKADHAMDQILSEHVMSLHSSSSSSSSKKRKLSSQSSSAAAPPPSSSSSSASLLLNRLRAKKGEIEAIPPFLLRKYIGYARKYVSPRLTSAAGKVLQEFFLDLRDKHKSIDSTPITTRQLESLIRLAEARAKLELREKVTKQDALDVVEIFKESLFRAFEDEFGNIDFKRSTGMSKKKQATFFIAQLQKIKESTSNILFTKSQMYKIAQDIGLKIVNFEDFLYGLNNQGYLLQKPNSVFELNF